MLLFSQHSFDAIRQDAVSRYPEECCGFLLGFEENNQRVITEIIRCNNDSEIKRKTFSISSNDYQDAEHFADDNGLMLLGIYHSHPDCAAIPSSTDRIAALPYFSYLIVSIFHHTDTSAKSWRLNESSLFEEENITLIQNEFSNYKNAYGNYYHTYTTA